MRRILQRVRDRVDDQGVVARLLPEMEAVHDIIMWTMPRRKRGAQTRRL